jgi:ubiquitin carboxyl-terminal hydrolase 25/28
MELAKLALVTSKDEEDDIEQTATDSSNDTDATLVEDSAPRAGTGTGGTRTGSPVGSPGASSSSVLGKRARDKEVVASRMSIDSDNFVIISKSPDADAGPSCASVANAADVEMKDAEAPAQSGAKPPPPPLPQRKTSESVMMFGAFDNIIIFCLWCVLTHRALQDDSTTYRNAWTIASFRSRLPCSSSTGWTNRKMESRAW